MMNISKAVGAISTIAFLILATDIPAMAQSWTELTPSGGPPTVRSHHSEVYDPTTNQMIVFDGINAVGHLNDLWSLSQANGAGPSTWTQVAPGGPIPAPRWQHTAAYDGSNDRMIVFGGGKGLSSPCTNEVWVLADASGAGGTPTWSLLTTGGPAPRFAHSAVYDPDSNKLIVFAGSNCISAPSFNDLWVLSNANGLGGPPTWALLGQSGSAPGFLFAHTAVYDSANNRMIVFGGDGGGGKNNNVWVLANADGTGGTPTWSLLAPSGTPPPIRTNHTAVYDVAANEMIVFGGGAPSPVNDVWVLSDANGIGTPAWTELSPSGTPPSAREAHTAVFDQATKRMTVFGGSGAGGHLNDTWVLALAVDTDADGILDAVDNCPTVPNPGQEQTGNNVGGPFGDACVDPTVMLPPDLDIGANPIIGANTKFGSGVTIGDNFEVGANTKIKENATLGDDVTLGDNVKIQTGVVIGDRVQIGDDSKVGEGAMLGNDVVLGKNVTIKAGVIIGNNVTVNDGITVKVDVPDGTVVS